MLLDKSRRPNFCIRSWCMGVKRGQGKEVEHMSILGPIGERKKI